MLPLLKEEFNYSAESSGIICVCIPMPSEAATLLEKISAVLRFIEKTCFFDVSNDYINIANSSESD